MSELVLKHLTPHVYYTLPEETTDRPILGAVAGESGLLMVEAAASPNHARQFLEELRKFSLPQPKFVAVTHWHWDHTFGSSALEVPIFAHAETAVMVQQMSRLDWRDSALDRRTEDGTENPFIRDHMIVEMNNVERAHLKLRVPDIVFTDQVEIYLGSISVQLIHVGGVHTSDSSVIFIPQDRVVFLGDCLYTSFADAHLNTPAMLLPLRERLLELEADLYLLAHQPEPITRAELEQEAEQLRLLDRILKPGRTRTEILAEAEKTLHAPLNDLALELVDNYLKISLEN